MMIDALGLGLIVYHFHTVIACRFITETCTVARS